MVLGLGVEESEEEGARRRVVVGAALHSGSRAQSFLEPHPAHSRIAPPIRRL